MKIDSIFDGKVCVVTTQVIDGNMKAVPGMDPLKLVASRENRSKAAVALGLDDFNTALLRITYDTEDFCKFKRIDSANDFCLAMDFSVEYFDGLLTQTPGLGILLPLADCIGLVLYAPIENALMVAHCGRHTLLQNGAYKAAQFMASDLNVSTENLFAWTSPAAGKDNYPVFEANNSGLQELAYSQLAEAGLTSDNIFLSTVDTTVSPEYFSASQGAIDRFAICAKLTGIL